MRKAFYYDSAFPPHQWLVLASLLWDKIWLSPLVKIVLSSPYLFEESRNTFLGKMYDSGLNVFDFSSPKTSDAYLRDNPKEEDHHQYNELIKRFVETITGRDLPIDEIDRLRKNMVLFQGSGDTSSALRATNRLKKMVARRTKEIVDEATAYNHAFLNSKFREMYPELDYFFAREKTFENYWPNSNKVFVHSVRALLPVDLGEITIPQIMDFRNETAVHRLNFKISSEAILENIMDASSEAQLQQLIKTYTDLLKDQLAKLETAYTHSKIKSVLTAIGVVTGVPTLLSLLGTALQIGIYEPAAIASGFSAAGASLKAALDKARAEVNVSQWGLLVKLQKLKRA